MLLSTVILLLGVIPITCLPLTSRCVLDHCPAVESEEWRIVQSRCCNGSDLYHCQTSPEGNVAVICAEARYCNATEAVVVTKAGVECRRCDPETQQRVTGPSHHHTDLPVGCGDTNNPPPARRPYQQRGEKDKDVDGDITRQVKPASGYSDNSLSTNETSEHSTNQISDAGDIHGAAWYIVVVLVSTATLALLVLGIIVYFVVKCYSNRTRQVIYKPM